MDPSSAAAATAAAVATVLRPASTTGSCQGGFTGAGRWETVLVRGFAGLELLRGGGTGGGRWVSVGWAPAPVPVVHVATVPRQEGRGDAEGDRLLWLTAAGRLAVGAWVACEGPEAEWTLVEVAAVALALDVDPDPRSGPGGLGLLVDPTATWVALLARAGAVWVVSVDLLGAQDADGALLAGGVWRVALPSAEVPTVWAGAFVPGGSAQHGGRLVLGVELGDGTPAALCVNVPACPGLEPVTWELGQNAVEAMAARLVTPGTRRHPGRVTPVHAVYACGKEGTVLCVTDEGVHMTSFVVGGWGEVPCVCPAAQCKAVPCHPHGEGKGGGDAGAEQRDNEGVPFVTCCAQLCIAGQGRSWASGAGPVLVQFDSGILFLMDLLAPGRGPDGGENPSVSKAVGQAPVGYHMVQIAGMHAGHVPLILSRDMADALEVTVPVVITEPGASYSAPATVVDGDSSMLWSTSPGTDLVAVPTCTGGPDAIVVCSGVGVEGALTVVRNEIGCEDLGRNSEIVQDQGLCGLFSFPALRTSCPGGKDEQGWHLLFCFPMATRVMKFSADGRLEDVTDASGFLDEEETICAGTFSVAWGTDESRSAKTIDLGVQVTPSRVCCMGPKFNKEGLASLVDSHWLPAIEGVDHSDTITVAAIGIAHVGVLLKSSRLLVLLGPTKLLDDGGSTSIELREKSPSIRIEEEISCMALCGGAGGTKVFHDLWTRIVVLGTFSEKVLIVQMSDCASRVTNVLNLRQGLAQSVATRMATTTSDVASMPLVVESAVLAVIQAKRMPRQNDGECMDVVLGLRSGTLVLFRVHMDCTAVSSELVEAKSLAQLKADLSCASIEQLGDAPMNVVLMSPAGCGSPSILVSGGGAWYCTLVGGLEVVPVGVPDTGVERAVSFTLPDCPLGVAILSADALCLLSLEHRDHSYDAHIDGTLMSSSAHPVYPSVQRLALEATPLRICGLQDCFPGHAIVCCTDGGDAPTMHVVDIRCGAGRLVSSTMLHTGDQVMALATAGPHVAIALHGCLRMGRVLSAEGVAHPHLHIETSCSMAGPVPGVAFMAEEAAGVLSPRSSSDQKRQRRILTICGETIVCLVLVLSGEGGEAELLTVVKTHDLGYGMLTSLHLCPGGRSRFAVGTSAYGALVLDLELLQTQWSEDEPSLILIKFHLTARTPDELDFVSSVADVHMLDDHHLAVMRRSGRLSIYAVVDPAPGDPVGQQGLIEVLSHVLGNACLRLRKGAVARERKHARASTLLMAPMSGGLEALYCLPRDANVLHVEALLGQSTSVHDKQVRSAARIDSLLMLSPLSDPRAPRSAEERDFIRRFSRQIY